MFNSLDLSEECRIRSRLSDEEEQLVFDRLINHFDSLLDYLQPVKVIERHYNFIGEEKITGHAMYLLCIHNILRICLTMTDYLNSIDNLYPKNSPKQI